MTTNIERTAIDLLREIVEDYEGADPEPPNSELMRKAGEFLERNARLGGKREVLSDLRKLFDAANKAPSGRAEITAAQARAIHNFIATVMPDSPECEWDEGPIRCATTIQLVKVRSANSSES